MLALAEFLRRRLGYRFPPLGGAAFRAAFRLLPPVAGVELLPGVRAELNFADATMRATYWQGSRFEHPTPAVLLQWARSGATHFFDIGSNYGWFSYWLASQSPALDVHAFEPNPRTFARIEAILAANSAALGRMRAWNLGLSDEAGRLVLHPGHEDSGHSTFGAHPDLIGSGGDIAEVEVQTFDQWRRIVGLELPPVPRWLAKLDVEGFEAKVLRGMAEALAARAFAGLVVEMNEFTLGFCGSSPAEVMSLLSSHGYRRRKDIGPESGNAFFEPA